MQYVAEVNGKKIKKNLFEIKLGEFINRTNGSKRLSDLEMYEMKSYVIDKLIDDELLVQYAEKNSIYADLEEVKGQLKNISESFPKYEDFEASLNNLGISLEQLFEDIRNDIVIGKVFEKEIQPYLEHIDENAVEEFYEDNKYNFEKGPAVNAYHIFIKVDFNKQNDIDRCRKLIHEIYQKIKDGEDFQKLAKEFSECNSSSRGGDLGTFTYDEIDENFAEIIFKMKKGEISQPFATDEGFHIAFIKDYFEKYIPPFEQLKNKLSNYMYDLVENDAMEKFLENLRDNASIKIYEY